MVGADEEQQIAIPVTRNAGAQRPGRRTRVYGPLQRAVRRSSSCAPRAQRPIDLVEMLGAVQGAVQYAVALGSDGFGFRRSEVLHHPIEYLRGLDRLLQRLARWYLPPERQP